jgi:hypothetical protein
MRECFIDLGENFPYLPETFVQIRYLSRLILRVSGRLEVPPIAVAGSIADEYNAIQTENWGYRRRLDWALDEVLRSHIPEWLFAWSVRTGSHSKLLNATRHDIGGGNINIATARAIYDEFHGRYLDGWWELGELVREDIPNWQELVAYVLTTEGTVVVAALVIKKGMQELAPFLEAREQPIKEALLVTYYKQGPSYVHRFQKALARSADARLMPGEGCRAYAQRADLQSALGI